MKKITITFCALVCLLISATAQVTVSGVTMAATVKADNTDLILNGAGVRVKFFMDIYVAGLYTKAKGTDGNAISKADEPSEVKLNIVSGMATSERMADAVKEGFQKSTGTKNGPLQPKIERFIKLFAQAPIEKEDIFENIYIPSVGVKIYKNGKLLDTIDGLDFKTALWGIWLGNDPADKNLKAAMLGTAK